MTTHISVSLSSIAELATNLGALHTDFSTVPESATETAGAISARDVLDALDEFSNNWKTRRGRLLESIDAVQRMASDAESSFKEVDLKLANEILGT